MLPFARNESTRFISPTKTPEYLAAGKPVVSTSIRDVVRPYGQERLVRIADTIAEFVAAAEAAMSEDTQASGWLDRVDAFLEQISWDRTWSSMMQLIESALATRLEKSIASQQPSTNGKIREIIDLNQPPAIVTRDFVFDYLIVGAGFSGSVIAERIASQLGKNVLVVDKRNHIGGNAYDRYDESGILVHKYSPHIFHTNSREVFEYLSRFTEWRSYEHRVLASVEGQLVPIPINLDTINKLYGLNLTSFQVPEFFASIAEPKDYIRTSEDVVVSKVGRELYEKFFRNYTRKQWGLDPSELDKSVISRIPTRTNRDDRYFTDTYQAMPLHGFTRMFENMLSHPNIKVMLNTDYREIEKAIPCREMVYTGPVDEFFDMRYGKLPYRSLEFKHETHNKQVFQPAPFDQLERNGHATRLNDLDLFAELGVSAIRYPVLWERTAPNSLKTADWSWADERLERLRELGIRPIVGLVHHGSGPRHTSLIAPAFARGLAQFARAVAERYPWVTHYTPVNEPLTTARFSGLYGHWYPHGCDGLTFARALLTQCHGIKLSMWAIRQVNPDAQLVQTEDLGKISSTPLLTYQAEFENERRWLSFDLLCGRVNRDHPMWDYLRSLGISEGELELFLESPCPPDIIGMNHYVTSDRFSLPVATKATSVPPHTSTRQG
jgi:UDP-galactopyranose mutase